MSDGSSPSRVGPGITPGPTAALDLSGDPRRHRRERAMGSLFFVAAVMSPRLAARSPADASQRAAREAVATVSSSDLRPSSAW